MIQSALDPIQFNMLYFFGSFSFLCVLIFLVSWLFKKQKGIEKKSKSENNSPKIKYDVFVNFRGKDTRRGILSHLTEAFQRSKIHVFVDDKNLYKGEEMWPSLVDAIEESFILLIIFSQNYASSSWCLEELVTVLECKEKYGRIVIPVFYKVDPTHVRHQSSESYKSAFARHGRKHKTKVQLWRHALNKSTDLSGIDSSNFLTDAELVKKIVNTVQERLVKPPINSKRLVGIDEKIATIESWIRKESKHTCLIGIWGMGGIGKTTLAEEVFNKLQYEYEASYFLANERDQSNKHELISLKKKIFSKLIGYDVEIETPNSLPENILRRIGCMKVLIVLDDVDDSEHLEKLLGSLDNFGSGSIIIVTTRDEQVLKANKADEIYQLKEFNSGKALELFNLNAFNQSDQQREYIELSERVINYAQGIPLVVKVLAGLLHGKNKEEWEGMLDKLKQMPPTKVYQVMKLSFDGLDRKEQHIFLDLACFFLRTQVPVNVGNLKSLLKDNESDNSVAFVLGRLKDKALITISEDNIVSMHDSLQEMAWEVVRQESTEDPGSRSRLWDADDIYEALKNDKVNEFVRSIRIHLSTIKEPKLVPLIFAKMKRLKFLEISSYDWRDQLILAGWSQFLAYELRFLSWDYYPLKSLPDNFFAEKLVILKLPFGRMEKLWDGVKSLVNLQQVDLTKSRMLKKLPDFSKATNIEVLILRDCSMLTSVHPSIFSLPKLKELDLFGCTFLTKLTSNSHLCSLSHLNLDCCMCLTTFSLISENMKELRLKFTKVKALPSSINNLKQLLHLDISFCSYLETIPVLPLSLETLDARKCKSLKTVLVPSTAIDQLKENRKRVLFWNCCNLDEHSVTAIGLNAQINVMNFANQHLSIPNHHHVENYNDYEFNYRSYQAIYGYLGSSVPEWLEYKTTKDDYIIIDLSSTPPSPFLGFIFCFVLGKYPQIESIERIEVNITICDGEDEGEKDSVRIYRDETETNKSDQMCVIYDQRCSDFLNRRAKSLTRFKIQVSLEARSRNTCYALPQQVLKEFGVSTISTSTYNSFIQQMELRDSDSIHQFH